MFGRRLRLFTLFGFDVHVDPTWFIILLLVTWSLATGAFPAYYSDLPPATYWTMGFVGALGLFASIVLHELAHSLVARRFGVRMQGITLFIFGGVAEMGDEPPSPRAEFNLAVAGPLASVAIGLGCYGLALLGAQLDWPPPVVGVLAYLGIVNGVLVAFNLIPAFPLDGGRVLRSILWHWKGNLRWATRFTSQLGAAFALALILLGVFSFIGGNFIGGMWWFLIGLFLYNAARQSYQQLLVRRALEGEPVRRFMSSDVQTVAPDLTVQELVEDKFYRLHYKMFPVVDQHRLLGCVTPQDVRELPREFWSTQHVADVLTPCSSENTIAPDADATRALAQMTRGGASRLMVVENGRLLGILALRDLMRFIALKMELEGDEDAASGPSSPAAREHQSHAA